LTRFLASLEASVLIEGVSVEQSEQQVFIPEGPVVHFVVEASLS
jgi:hypothetical protein